MPLKIDIFKEASARRKMEFSVRLASLPKVSEIASDSSLELRVIFLFGIDENKQVYVDVTLNGTLSLRCQRCLGSMPFELSAHHRLVPVKTECLNSDSDSGSDLLGEVEPVLMDEIGMVDVVQMLEDEVLLALPMCSMHPIEDCAISFPESELGQIEQSDMLLENQKTRKSFAGLAKLLDKSSN